MRVLLITAWDFTKADHGGSIGTKKNLDIIKSFTDRVDVVFAGDKTHLNKFKTRISLICAGNFYYSLKEIKKIIKMSKTNKYDVIFVEYSFLGFFAKIFKKKFNIKVITFFHNIETKFISSAIKKGNDIVSKLKMFFYSRMCIKNEKKAVKYSDKIIVLSNRDLEDLKHCHTKEMRHFAPENVSIIPVTLEDRLTEKDIKKMNCRGSGLVKGLFLGSYTIPNYEGIKWFVDNVAERTNAQFIIAGNKIDCVLTELVKPNVEVLGRQDDVKKLYLDADFVIAPIFSGSGMKTKTCEALMFGKTVFGTNESFSGFDIDYDKVGGLCNTSDEFIEAINNFVLNKERTKLNEYSRQVYLEKYSNDAVKEKFISLFEDVK